MMQKMVGVDFPRMHPAEGFTFLIEPRLDFRADREAEQKIAFAGRHSLAQGNQHGVSDLDPRFLAQFAARRLFRAFAAIKAAAEKIPLSGIAGGLAAFGQQYPPTGGADDGDPD